MPLSDLQVRTAKPQDRDYWITDERGLRLLVKSNGSKYWRFKYRFDGKQKTLALGVYPDVSLKMARDRREDARRKIANEEDPGATRKLAKIKRKRALGNTFEHVAREWWDIQRDTWTERHAERVWQRLRDNSIKAFGKLPVEQVKAQDVLEVIRRIERRGAIDLTKRVLQDTNRVLDYAVQIGRMDHNPSISLRGVVKHKKVEHLPSLPPEQLPQFVTDLEEYPLIGRKLTQLAIKLLLLTFVRPGELRTAEWNEFDLEDRLWRVPSHKMKMKTEHLVPLADQTLETLEEIREITGRYEFLFPSERNRFKPMSDNTLRKAMFIMGYDGKHTGKAKITPHGFRATASSVLNENGFNPDAIERQLSHIERNKVRSAYTHHARFLDDRRKMMQWWANYLLKP
ncbi:MAG: tyrosine-type recombinase/integrase [Porticoccaceae bacterium]